MDPKQPNSFACPSCATRLRLGSKFFEQRQVPCPECKTELLVSHSEDGIIATFESPKPAPLSQHVSSLSLLLKRLIESPRRTQWIAGGVTSVLTLVVAVVLIIGGDDKISDDQHASNVEAQSHKYDMGNDSQQKLQEQSPDLIANVNSSNTKTDADIPSVPLVGSTKTTNVPGDSSSTPSAHDQGVVGLTAQAPLTPVAPGSDPTTDAKSASGDIGKGTDSPKSPIQQVANNDPDKTANVEPVPATEQRPAEPVTEPAPIVINKPKPLSDRLAQPVASFKQSSPVALATLIDVVEELAQVEITFGDSVSAEMREQPVTLDLARTTPREILEQVAARAKLQVVIDEQTIRLEPLKD